MPDDMFDLVCDNDIALIKRISFLHSPALLYMGYVQ